MICRICNKDHAYTAEAAVASLAATPRKLEKIAGGLTARRAAARTAPGKWSAKEIVLHLADCELVYGVRYRKILSEPDPVLVPFDQEAWATLYTDKKLKDGLEMFKAVRAANVALLKTLTRADWNKTGKHPDYGLLTLREIVVHLVDHDRNHVAQVADRTA